MLFAQGFNTPNDGDQTTGFANPFPLGSTQVAGECTADETAACLNNGRFKVEVRGADGEPFPPTGVEEDNTELFDGGPLVRVLTGCDINQNFWVFAATGTDVEYTLEVTDTALGEAKEYQSLLGQAAPAVTDTSAFATCP